MCMLGQAEVVRGYWIPLELVFQEVVSCCVWKWRTRPEASTREAKCSQLLSHFSSPLSSLCACVIMCVQVHMYTWRPGQPRVSLPRSCPTGFRSSLTRLEPFKDLPTSLHGEYERMPACLGLTQVWGLTSGPYTYMAPSFTFIFCVCCACMGQVAIIGS